MQTNLDRFSRPMPWEKNREPCYMCDVCGRSIYPGDTYYCVGGNDVCCWSEDCLARLVDAQKKEAV